jgi:hypothetical protein
VHPRLEKNSGARVVAVAMLFPLLAGCASPSVDEFGEVHARLNFETGTIYYPLDSYALSSVEGQEVAHANALLVSDCMASAGYDYPRINDNWEQKLPQLERRYGLWSPQIAVKFGYSYPDDQTSLDIDREERTRPDAWWDQAFECLNSTTQFPPMTVNGDVSNPSPVDAGVLEAYRNMMSSAVYGEQRELWVECMGTRGILPDTSTNLLLPDLPVSDSGQAEIAQADVACKEELGTIQIVADLESQYQAVYIEAHESELVEYQERAKAILEKAREIVARYG